jgi:hypothetical protein
VYNFGGIVAKAKSISAMKTNWFTPNFNYWQQKISIQRSGQSSEALFVVEVALFERNISFFYEFTDPAIIIAIVVKE